MQPGFFCDTCARTYTSKPGLLKHLRTKLHTDNMMRTKAPESSLNSDNDLSDEEDIPMDPPTLVRQHGYYFGCDWSHAWAMADLDEDTIEELYEVLERRDV